MANKNYPHPVLNKFTDDFIHDQARFDILISQKTEGHNYKLICNVNLNEDNLEQLLKNDEVTFVVKLVCTATRYRAVFEFNELQKTIILPSSDVEKKIELSTFIISKTTIESYSSQAFNPDYEDATFHIFAGDILAEGSEYSMDVNKKIDPLTKVPSIFTIVSNSDKNSPPIDVQSIGNKIVITLNSSNFESYKKLKQLQNQYNQLAALTSSIFITPAMVMILDDVRQELSCLNDYDSIKEYIEEHETEHRWFKVINMKLKDLEIDLYDPENISDSSFVLAQKLLGDPLSNGLEFFEELFSTQDEEEEV
ncbi:hypothetical protein [Ureibacillus chungkukjangi]|uniref:hypothetical protein n=1 Tax=Ureibacillus chungkukjangi TaxID=1202712 RepID=UPI000D3D105F|nr:hypothetical protein [Ureibacillus chungkukjangi]